MARLLASGIPQATFWMPKQASTVAYDVDWIFYFILYLSAVFFVVIAGAMFWFMWRYRRRSEDQPVSGPSHHTGLELTWSIIPAILLVPMFWWGFVHFLDARTPPVGSYDINVIAQKWSWRFIYPNGFEDNVLHVPAGVPVRMIMSSQDVIHSLFVPAFRVKRDIVPGRYSFLWFEAKYEPKPDNPGAPNEHPLFCAEYCGTSHSDMISRVMVHPDRAAFDEWLANADPLKQLTEEEYALFLSDPDAFVADRPELKGRLFPPVELGQRLYRKKSCVHCHSLDGSPGNGPTWKGVYGHEVVLRDGSRVIADENYLRESILQPNAKIVAGFQAIMPAPNVNEREMHALIEFIKSLKD